MESTQDVRCSINLPDQRSALALAKRTEIQALCMRKGRSTAQRGRTEENRRKDKKAVQHVDIEEETVLKSGKKPDR
jgi:hypothetical protein